MQGSARQQSMPSRLPSFTTTPKQSPFPPAVCIARLHRYYEPLELPLGWY
jgi:hypothetical protein